MIRKGEYTQSVVRVLICTYLYVLLEWLFFVTKPSFLSIRPWSERITALLVGVWPFLVVTLILHIVIIGFTWIVDRLGRKPVLGRHMLALVPSLILATLAIILIDNFTYTAFTWGIVKTGPYTIPLYWLAFVGIFILILRSKLVCINTKPMAVGALLVLLVVPLIWAATGGKFIEEKYDAKRSDVARPNIIMFASDGVNADHMSAYGYYRDTTPNLDSRLGSALIAENAFTNVAMTIGSLTSTMTGKYGATTRVFYPPQTLTGRDAYEHLPRVLRKLGYRSLQETIGYYADARQLNWLDSFDYSNGRALHWTRIDKLPIKLQAAGQLVVRLHDRLEERLQQLLFLKRMTDHYAGVVSSEKDAGKVVSDRERMARVFGFIERERQPFFVHIHLMGTHCCKWRSKDVHFQVGADASESERTNALFDDSIRRSDEYFGEMMKLLERKGILDNTIVVYSSDHVKGWDFRSQVPLIFFFPHGEHKGKLMADAQLIDVAPTILDYLRIRAPAWMEGRSLIGEELPEHRPIFVGYRAQYLDTAARHADIGPPYYDLAKAGLVECNRWYIFSLDDRSIESGLNANYRGSCDGYAQPDDEAAELIISKHLHQRGFIF